ncbi:MarR family winged helix-turn-helix transcriptional regulator [Noviherbaspirillum pedocola]|uniref:MarR family transcriptional regulator n=1 Tax=Noviherbaspirillum pedocola TaxID=2801341 RepID=A0A934SXM6_9BURK|nr:MarR family transcriptional regulator [Noviherbaspirillum pedocola]
MDEFDHTLMQLTMGLTSVSRAYKSAADRLAADFSLSQATGWPVVMIGRLGDGVRPGALADSLGLEPSSLVRVIDQLIDAGLVERRDDANDRRARTLHLTDSGREAANRLEAALLPFRRQLFDGVPRADIDAFMRILQHITTVLADNSVASGRSPQ